MSEFFTFLVYLLVMSGVTYLLRMIPLAFVRRKIRNRFICSFLYYIPYAVLTVMTVPAIFYSTGHLISAIVGTAVALLISYFGRSLTVVALGAVLAVFAAEMIITYAPLI